MPKRQPHPPLVKWRECLIEGCLRAPHAVPEGYGCFKCQPGRYQDPALSETPIEPPEPPDEVPQ